MTNRAVRLDAAFIRSRRIACGLTVRAVAKALGLSERGWQHIEDGRNGPMFTLGQLGVLADLLAVDVGELLSLPAAHRERPTADPLERSLGVLLFLAGRAVPIGALAAALESTTEQVERATAALRDRLGPAGIAVVSTKAGVNLLPGGHALRDTAVRTLLRGADRRGAVSALPARLLHALARGDGLPVNLSYDERLRLTAALHAGWVVAPPGRPAAQHLDLHPDVRYALLLDEGYTCRAAKASTTTAPHGPRRRGPGPLPAAVVERSRRG